MKKKILVIGDVLLDRYVYGTVERISPEAPVPVLNMYEEKENIGGAGVVAENLVNLGNEALLFGIIGKDDEAEIIRNICKKIGIDAMGLMQDESKHTITKTRYVATSPFWQYILRVDKEHDYTPSLSTIEIMKKELTAAVSKCDGIIISDYKKGTMTKEIINLLLKEAKKNKKMLIVDTKGKILDYKGASIVAPNRKELFEIFGQKATKDLKQVKFFAKKLAEMMRCIVVVKLGEDGVLLITKEREMTFPSEAKKIVNVSGAGDIFIAILANEILSGKGIIDAVKIANKGAGVAIGKEKPTINVDEIYEKGYHN
ncbi:MAG: PfkB family carbohydrate kinase [Candidatus Anstonellales archaeon]